MITRKTQTRPSHALGVTHIEETEDCYYLSIFYLLSCRVMRGAGAYLRVMRRRWATVRTSLLFIAGLTYRENHPH